MLKNKQMANNLVFTTDFTNQITTSPDGAMLVLVTNQSGASMYVPISWFQSETMGVDSVTGAGNISVDNTDPQNPIVSITATPSFTGVSSATIQGTIATARVVITDTTVGVGGTDGNIGLGIASKGTGSITFSTNSIEKWLINSSGAFNPNIDNSYDIGNHTVNPRDIHASRSFLIKGIATEGYSEYTQKYTTASTTFSGGATETIAVQIPSNARIIGTTWRIDTNIVIGGGGVDFSLAYSVGATQTIVANESTLTQNNKGKAFFDSNAATNVTSAITDITVTPNAGTLTSGAITCVVFYETLTNLTDVV